MINKTPMERRDKVTDVDIPDFMKQPAKQYYSIEISEYEKMQLLNKFKTRMAFLNGLAIGAITVLIATLFIVVAVVLSTGKLI